MDHISIGSSGETYSEPVAKTAAVKIFFFLGICNLQSECIGRNKIAKSVTTLKTPVAKNVDLTSITFWTIESMNDVEYMIKQLQMRDCVDRYMTMLPCLFGTKILRYWRRIDHLTRKMIGQ